MALIIGHVIGFRLKTCDMYTNFVCLINWVFLYPRVFIFHIHLLHNNLTLSTMDF